VLWDNPTKRLARAAAHPEGGRRRAGEGALLPVDTFLDTLAPSRWGCLAVSLRDIGDTHAGCSCARRQTKRTFAWRSLASSERIACFAANEIALGPASAPAQTTVS
jgi:hypothetical protein